MEVNAVSKTPLFDLFIYIEEGFLCEIERVQRRGEELIRVLVVSPPGVKKPDQIKASIPFRVYKRVVLQ